ncbi:MAG: Asp-tRNA(Asn)/Glu-tRNA(Gln) amidotransferase subunit GatC [Candidatus Carbobacillus altaicus]|uniref:Aspartyl/glutamyl-tRNA(Asn/Gln) amidotransferase subunit C n=1 Tax=Candidatus Carbonibacillus altaicus TaxID=2163959 RepID=A0A2R6Y481_9BACL|nr:Asp-tRNA(Asn)/Glu-tRNA(Gln) amidotransferase subunit GatC [Candidatus Carbobacillus altaicus]PTQ57481.1 MAG: Aspartyl-tRNA(Asn) amidotransferase subunit C [Candidatus Carbobacillus altaicus]
MQVTRDTVKEIADYAMLTLNEQELEHMVRDMQEIVSFVEKLNEVPTDGVEPMIHPVKLMIVMHDDTVQRTEDLDAVLGQAPDRSGSYFQVPQVLGES